MIIDRDAAPCVVLVVLDVDTEEREAALGRSISFGAEALPSGPGFAGGMWLGLDPRAPSSDPAAPDRIVAWWQWERRQDAQAFLADPAHAEHLTALSTLGTLATRTYSLSAVIDGDGSERSRVDRDDPGPGRGLLFFEPAAGTRDWVLEYNVHSTRDHIRHLDGFLSASFLVDEDGDGLAEWVQWASPGHLGAAVTDTRFREHMEVTERYATTDVRLYSVVHDLAPASSHRA